jgi:hypothetical protein
MYVSSTYIPHMGNFFNIEVLCKHACNNWQMGSKPIAQIWLHKSQSWETSLILHVAYYLQNGQSSQFHIFKEVGE